MATNTTSKTRSARLSSLNGHSHTHTHMRIKATVAHTPDTESTTKPSTLNQLFTEGTRIQKAIMEKLGLPSFKRQVIACITAVVTAGLTYAAGVCVTDYLLVAAMAHTTSSFLLIAVLVIGGALSAFAAYAVGYYTYDVITGFSVPVIKAGAKAISSRVKRLFSRKADPIVVAI